MNRIIRSIALLLTLALSTLTASAQQDSYKVHKYNTTDGGILSGITPNGKWAIIRLGSVSGGGTATPKLYDIDKDEVISIEYSNRTFEIASVSNDGNMAVGAFMGRPASYNRATKELKVYPLRQNWQYGTLTHITPDGKWAIGAYNGYLGQAESEDAIREFCYSPLFVNVETGDTIATPNLPKRDMAHANENTMRFNSITPDGRFILGEMDWHVMQPISGFSFIYDVEAKSYKVIGFTENDNKPWTALWTNLHHLEYPVMSPNGRYVVGLAYMAESQEGSEFFKEYGSPFRYDMQTGSFVVFDKTDANIDGCIVNDNGTIIADPNTGSPLRDFRILYQDKYWITLAQITKQYYGFNFAEKTGYERTGSAFSVSGDGSRLICVPDPLGESYCFDFVKPIEEVCNDIDLLDNYTVSPSEGAVFSQISTVEINFGRPVQVIGTGKNVHLYKADGTKVSDGLTAGTGGLVLKSGSKTTVNAIFRTRQLEAGEKYYVSIDAGAISVANDDQRINKEIRINYTGRTNGPVTLTKATPENHSQLRQIDASSSYILLTFDCPVKTTEDYSAYIERIEDGTRMATLSISEGNTEATKNQVLITPTSTINLYEGLEYKVVIEAGSICDYSGAAVSYNEEIVLNYHGTYVREVSTDEILFSDDFTNPDVSYNTWLRYEGDHHTPLASMQNWKFDADNMPWQYGMSDDENYSNIFAGSHSLYAPSAASDDWMLTPQILLPADAKVVLEFDAQSYNPNKSDVLKLYVYEQDFEIPAINDAWMNDDDGIRKNAVLLDEIKLTAGASQEKTDGEWTHYFYDLSKWAGKNIYVAFVNQNNNQSAIFVDNVVVKRDVLYAIAFSNSDRVVGAKSINIAGQFTVKTAEPVGSISLILRDSEEKEVSTVSWPSITGNIQGRAIPFSFSNPLPLALGQENKYTIDIVLGDKKDTFHGSIFDYAFQTTKHVVLEEMTGIDCPNCPQGILAIEKCEKTFGDRFIPISIHTYTGDPYAGVMGAYSTFLGLNSAPSARINRISGVYYPMITESGTYYDTYPANPVWYDVVASELNKLSAADIEVSAVQSEDGKNLDYYVKTRYALNATDQQLSLFIAILENGLVNYQINNLGTLSQPLFGEWGEGGSLSGTETGGYAYPVTHNDVVRSVVGQTLSGTIGLFPSTFEAGKWYSASLSSKAPEAISDLSAATVVAMLIDTQTGEIINANKTKVQGYSVAVEDVTSPASLSSDIYTLSGVLVRKAATRFDLNSLPKGLYIFGGKKVMVR